MSPDSNQFLSVQRAFADQGWRFEVIAGREVIRAGFDAHHTRIDVFAQAHPRINALSVVAETPLTVPRTHLPLLLELLARANKPLTLGGFEYDPDRHTLVFRLANLFERDTFAADIVSAMVRCAIAEMDRLTPCAAIVRDTPAESLARLDPAALLAREDLLPPLAGGA
jgi:hypothetical protein